MDCWRRIGKTVQHSRDLAARYLMGGEARKPGAISLRMAIAQRGCVELPPWRTMLMYDRYDSTHWSALHAARVLTRFLLSLIWAAMADHNGRVVRHLAIADEGQCAIKAHRRVHET